MRIQQQNPKRGDWRDMLLAGSLRVIEQSSAIVIIESNGREETSR